jgi:hypothetical protein
MQNKSEEYVVQKKLASGNNERKQNAIPGNKIWVYFDIKYFQ